MNTPTKTSKRLGVKVTGTPDEGQRVTVDSEDTLQKLFGTNIPDVADGLLRHCIKVLKNDEITDEHAGNDERMFLVGVVTEIKPRDGVERMLAVQMAATHVAMIRAGRLMANASNLAQTQAHSNGYTKLARTFTAQMEALRKHRNGGKQTVVVQHVTVEGGGQAIVGNVETGGGRE